MENSINRNVSKNRNVIDKSVASDKIYNINQKKKKKITIENKMNLLRIVWRRWEEKGGVGLKT